NFSLPPSVLWRGLLQLDGAPEKNAGEARPVKIATCYRNTAYGFRLPVSGDTSVLSGDIEAKKADIQAKREDKEGHGRETA
ncbi:MAG TPA: hypothetical protein VMZ92_15210, partial [Planctomycetota bacterium]|nr:hypothetical protein [Planctomycetota bacterium]